MRAGSLRHLVTIEEPVLTADGMGGFTEVWSEFTTTNASITQLKGEELLEHMKLGSNVSHRIWMRYQDGITAKMRIKHDDRTFRIIGNPRNPDERNKDLNIMAEEDTE